MSEKFHKAAQDGYLDLLKEGTRKDMNTADEDGNTPTLLAAHHGNLDALRMVIMRGGDPNKMDLLGYTALHHAASNGHMNCISFLINFGANIWAFDNDMHSALDTAALGNYDDIVKFLDEAQTSQQRKNPKIVQSLKEKSIKNSERNAKYYERLQDKANRELTKSRRHEQQKVHGHSDFKAPTGDASVFKKISLRIKSTNALKSKMFNGTNHQFSEYTGSRRGGKPGTQRGSGEITSVTDFHISETDESGKRTLKSLRPMVAVKRDDQVMYMTNKITDDSGTRPGIANVFPNTSLGTKAFNAPKQEANSVDDSGIDSFENDDEDTSPSIFSLSGFGGGVSNISFLNRFDHMASFPNPDSSDNTDEALENGDGNGGANGNNRFSSGTDSIGTTGSSDLPWHDDDVEALDDDEQETEYSPVILLLESCGLTHYTQVFTSADVDMDALMLLTNQDFQDMNIPIGPRRKLMDAIQRRKLTLQSPTNIHDTHL